ncbi:family 16 glycosylhydrolase [Sphingobacterium gobiense]|uniref:GH16 domain-containing protein n=1 Tax=Sphingobacterium gobiense TaxID=1382456 RepID=A0A2S9JTI9_9SPHI|nr:family 16 glycosylhydrolase [Sphingobacterium gobiense]PRD56518.1 hypothetical protein C5749_04555 [Sphingobacterium gobiense]
MRIIYLVCLFLCCVSCSKSNDSVSQDPDDDTPVAESKAIVFKHESTSNLNYYTASLSFQITEGNTGVLSRGVAYALHETPTVDDAKASAQGVSGGGRFTVKLEGLLPGKMYYVRPFAKQSSGISYGEEITFSTIAFPEPIVYLDSTTFENTTKFEEHWNMFYPWGTDHNGSARMYEEQVSLVGDGELKVQADRTEEWEGNSSADPWLRIYYHSGAIHYKNHITVTDEEPYWIISGDFKVPTMVGSWPAFWITGAWNWPPEIDIMEFKGNSTNWQNTVTGPNWQNTSWQTTKTYVANAGDWHNYKLVMYKTSATDIAAELFIDGEKKATHHADFVAKPFWLIINMQMEGASGGHASGPQHAEMYARNVYVAAYDVIP